MRISNNRVASALILLQFILIPAILAGETKDLEIGIITELSGPFAANGDDCKTGHETAIKAYTDFGTIGGRKVKLIYGDSKGEGKTAITEAGKIISGHKALALIVNRSQAALPLSSLSKTKKLPLIAVAGHSRLLEMNPYAFRLFPSAENETPVILESLKKRGIKTISVISLQDEYLISLKENLVRIFKETGGEVLYDDSINEGETDLTSIATKISNVKAEAVFINLGLNQSGVMIKKLREQNVKSVFFSNFWVQKKEVIDSAGKENIEGTFFIAIDTDLPRFANILSEVRKGLKPSGLTYSCHAALGFVLQALRLNPGIDSNEKLFNALQKMHSFELLDEQISIEEREAHFKMVEFVIRQGAAARP